MTFKIKFLFLSIALPISSITTSDINISYSPFLILSKNLNVISFFSGASSAKIKFHTDVFKYNCGFFMYNLRCQNLLISQSRNYQLRIEYYPAAAYIAFIIYFIDYDGMFIMRNVGDIKQKCFFR